MRCCRVGCSGSYDETDPQFRLREHGIQYFMLFLDAKGVNHNKEIQYVYVCYSDRDYLFQNWDQEMSIIRNWCSVLGFGFDDYHIVLKETFRSIPELFIEFFHEPLILDDSEEQ